MKQISHVSLMTVLILITFGFCIGCTSTQETTSIPAQPTIEIPMTLPIATYTPIPKTLIPTPTIAPTETPVPIYTAIEPEWTQPIPNYGPAENDTTKINFTQYTSKLFKAEYPASWTVTEEYVAVTNREFNGKDIYKPESTRTTFTSEDGNTRMSVLVKDLVAPNMELINPTIDTIKRNLVKQYPDINGETAIQNFRYETTDQNLRAIVYDVTLPDQRYTEQFFLTYSHGFEVRFTVVNSTLEQYSGLRYRMMKNVVTEGLQSGGVWW